MNLGKRWRNKTRVAALVMALMMLLLTGCSSTRQAETSTSEGTGSLEESSAPVTTEPASENDVFESDITEAGARKGIDRMFYAQVNGSVLSILAADYPQANHLAYLALKGKDAQKMIKITESEIRTWLSSLGY